MNLWLAIGVPAGCFFVVCVLLAVGLCEAASQGDEVWDGITDRRMLDEGGDVAEVVEFPRERRRSHARNGIGA